MDETELEKLARLSSKARLEDPWARLSHAGAGDDYDRAAAGSLN
jgi:hypothetical protein